MQVIQYTLPLLMLVFLLPFPGEAGEQEWLTGKIHSVDMQRGVMEIELAQGDTDKRRVQVALPAGPVTSDSMQHSLWNGCLVVGKEVQLWGYVRHDDGSFAAEQVRGCSMTGCNDPTGVRGRLYRNRQMGRQAALCRE